MNSIYQYINKINGHMYIGLAKDPERRYKDHLAAALNPKHKDYNLTIHKAIRKYGINNFDFIILEDNLQNIEIMKQREIFWINEFNTYKDRQHYNETPGGDLPGYNTIHKGSQHGKALLSENDVIFCREEYKKGSKSRDIYDRFFSNKITYKGFLKMWHGDTWKHIKPEVFNSIPHKGAYNAKDRDNITELFYKSGLSLSQFSKTPECYVGYGTLWKMIKTPSFYDGK